MTKQKQQQGSKRPILFVFLGIFTLVLIITLLLRGNDVALLNPKGTIARDQRGLMFTSVLLLLEIAIPTLTAFYFIAWKYRESNHTVTHQTKPRHSKALVFGIWAAPTTIMLILATVMWPATHRLAPQRALETGTKPLKIQVIAMRWKWLFIYPDQNIATINFIQIPIDTPIQFTITADETPMSSFWIPHLAGQLYAMTGHVNQLNLMADVAGDYTGSSAEINGSGFAGMRFTTRVSTAQDYNSWVDSVKDSKDILDTTEYQKLLVPSEYNKVGYYAQAGPDIYATMLTKYSGSHNHHTEAE